MEFVQENSMCFLIALNVLFLIISIFNNIKIRKLKKKYYEFMKKIGNGDNIEEILKKYINETERISLENEEIRKYCIHLNEKTALCIQKIGIVRYSAFRDTGSDLSFALAMLDENNNGVILNGIYSREMSNIYAKQIKDGESLSNLSEEEQEALTKAKICKINNK